jgi:type IV pilus assembly protein PilV
MSNSTQQPTSRPTQRGMAMIEVLVSILLFSLGVLGLIGLQASAIQFSVEADMRNRASLIANEVATAMWLSNSVSVDTEAGTPSWKSRVAAELPSGTITVTGVAAATMPNSADVHITWKPPQRAANDSDMSQLNTRVTLAPPP